MNKPYDDVWDVDKTAVDALAEPLLGTAKPLVVTFGTLGVEPDPDGKEIDETAPWMSNPISTRSMFEDYTLSLAAKGVRVMSVRLAAYTYGHGRSGVAQIMAMAARSGSLLCINGGAHHITTVHVDDGARLDLLVAEKGKAGEAYNAAVSTDLTYRQVAEAMAEALGVPVGDSPFEVAREQVGMVIATFLSTENRASGRKAMRELWWKPTEAGLLEEINEGRYQAVAKALAKE
jgi:nucleoside-diphosphate-sugar epimerase